MIIGCNSSNNSNSNSITTNVNVKPLVISNEKSNRIYGADTINIKYVNIEYKDFKHEGKYKLKGRMMHHGEYYLVKSEEEVNEIFESCDLIKNIDFNKYILIGTADFSNGSEKISKEVLSVLKNKTILVKINVSYMRNEKNMAYYFQTWVIIKKPEANWKIKVLVN